MNFTKILVLAIVATSLVTAIEFSYDLPVKKIQCFGDSLGELITVSIELYSPNPNYQFRVYDPEGKQVYNITESTQINKKLFFITQKEGNFQYCFSNLEAVPIKVKFNYKTGVEAKDYSLLVSKNDLKPIELQVEKMSDMLTNIGKEKRMIGRKGRYISRDADEVSFKVLAFSVITLLLMALLTGFQVVYLKNFFKSKKLI
ncbi:hypothetical protein ABPG74_010734 [Tetrahymena malaccensis]